MHTMPHVPFFGLGWVLLPLLDKNRKLGELRLGGMVLISVGLGTMAVLVGSMVAVAELWNFTGEFLGTWHILADLYWLVCDDI